MNVKKYSYIVTLIFLFSYGSACNMLAVIATGDSIIISTDQTVNDDFALILDEFRDQGGGFNDGWSMLYYNDIIIPASEQIARSAVSTQQSPALYDSIMAEINNVQNSARQILGHLRIGTSGALNIPNPHPFLLDLNGRTFSFIHNGTLSKAELLALLTDNGNDYAWLDLHPPDSYGNGDWETTGWDYVVDSELLFLWIMKNIVDSNFDIINGLQQSLNLLAAVINSPFQKNFIFSDGINLYLHGNENALFYSTGAIYDDANTNYPRYVMSEYPANGPTDALEWQSIPENSIIKIGPDAVENYFLPTVSPENESQPVSISLLPNYPNPFNSRTMITFEVAESVNYRLLIYDLTGNYINTLSAGNAVIGKYGIPWDGRDANNNLVASGSYFYLLITPSYNIAKKMQLIK